MMGDISPSDNSLRTFSLSDIQAYLSLLGWSQADSPRSNWLVYEGPSDASGDPLEIVLVRSGDSRKAYEYYASAINLLSALNDENPYITIERIRNYERDKFQISNRDSTIRDSIPLEIAARQVQGLRNLIRDAAELESKDPIPFNPRQPSAIAHEMARQYHFGHTFRGSFGLTVESPLNQYPFEYKQTAIVKELQPKPPLARRVLERIVRGLLVTKQTVEQKSDYPLISSYQDGFNANMCRSLLEISGDGNTGIEYSVLWSPTVQPSDDVARFSGVRLNRVARDYIYSAQEKLVKMVRPDTVIVRGLVEDIKTTDNPLGENARREIVVKWINRPDGGRAVGITIEIDADEYEIAHYAQYNWKSIEVEGEARYTGSKWILSNSRNFNLAEDSNQE